MSPAGDVTRRFWRGDAPWGAFGWLGLAER